MRIKNRSVNLVADQALFLGRMIFGQRQRLRIMALDASRLSLLSVPAFCHGLYKGTVLFVCRDPAALIAGAANDEDQEQEGNPGDEEQVFFLDCWHRAANIPVVMLRATGIP